MKTRTLLLALLLTTNAAFAEGDGPKKAVPAPKETCGPDAMMQPPAGTRCQRREVAPFVDPTVALGDWVAEQQRQGAGDR